tara:strand:- start:204 stop:398 length:195 start_codon:yes stop_codon:yes gene_type:complete
MRAGTEVGFLGYNGVFFNTDLVQGIKHRLRSYACPVLKEKVAGVFNFCGLVDEGIALNLATEAS